MNETIPEFLTIDQVAARLKRSRVSIYAAIKAGTIPCVRVGPQALRVPVSYLQELQAEASAGAKTD